MLILISFNAFFTLINYHVFFSNAKNNNSSVEYYVVHFNFEKVIKILIK